VHVDKHTNKQEMHEALPGPPDITWPFSLGSFKVSDVFSKDGFVVLVSGKGDSVNIALSDYLARDIGGSTVLLATPPENFIQAVQHFLDCKSKANAATSLHVLVQANHAWFAKKWRPLLAGMTRVPCPGVSGYAFWVDESAQPEETSAKLNSLEKKSPVMTFQGLASGALASILIDSGASHGFIDTTFAMHHGFARHPTKTSVKIADGTYASTTSVTNVRVKIQGHISEIPCYVIDMKQQYDVILGDTWLEKYDALLDYKTKQCIVRKGRIQVLYPVQQTRETKPGKQSINSLLLNAMQVKRLARQGCEKSFMIKVSDSGLVSEFSEKPSPMVQKLLDEYQDVFKPRDSLPPVRNIGHTIPLEPGHKPPFKPIFRLSPVELAEVETQVKELLKQGLIEPSSSPDGAPVLFVAKKDGSLRMCIDYRALNKITIKNKYPLPRTDQLLDSLAGAKVFTSLDLQSGYHQIRITPEDIPKTAFRTPFGHYQFKVLSFGLTNAPATFQAAMNDLFRPFLNKCVVVYIDDILIFSKNKAEHVWHLQQVLEVLRENKFNIKLSKCEFEKPEVKFLGHIVGADGVKVDPAKTAVVTNWPVPNNLSALRSFVGLATYFRKFIRKFSKIVAPLQTLPKRMCLINGLTVAKKHSRQSNMH